MALLTLAGAGCGLLASLEGGPEVTVTVPEGGIVDVVVVDHAAPDLRRAEAAGSDVAPADAALTDAGLPDAASTDVALPDTALPDALSPDAAVVPWHLSGYNCRARLDLQNQDLTAALPDFTLLVELDPASLSCSLRAFDPHSIAFVDAAGTSLFHELEFAPPGTPTPAWVRLPSVEPAPAGAHLWLYFGTTQSGTAPPPSQAWGPAFRGVWHLDEDLDLEGFARDSTSYHNDASPSGVMGASSRSPGLVGHALYFDGFNDRLVIGDPVDDCLDFDGQSSFTYSLSVQADDDAGIHDMPWHKGGSSQGIQGYDLELGTGCWGVGLSDGVSAYELLCFDPPGNPASRWINIAVVVDRGAPDVRVYMDGAQVFLADLPQSYDVRTHISAIIGADPYGDFAFHGLIDEVRVVAAARTAEWIATEERSLRGELVVIGPVESGG